LKVPEDNKTKLKFQFTFIEHFRSLQYRMHREVLYPKYFMEQIT